MSSGFRHRNEDVRNNTAPNVCVWMGPGGGECVARVWEGVKPGTVSKSYGQGHWAYGRTAAAEFGKKARGVNNNTIIPWELERLSGSNARNGGHTLVKIEKV